MVENRKQLSFHPRSASYSVAETANVPPEIAAVVVNHYWTQKEARDGTYSYADLLDLLEMINVDNENRHRDYEHYEMLRRLTDYG